MLTNELSDLDLDSVAGGAEKDCRLVGKKVTKDGNGKVVSTELIYDCKPEPETKSAPLLQ
jgi:hypothetical protein